jgi:hypothetical protein
VKNTEVHTYKDTKKYRYIFKEEKHTEYVGSGPNAYGSNTFAKFLIEDRITGKIYRTKHGTGAFSKWMRVYIQALEKTRQKNKQA